MDLIDELRDTGAMVFEMLGNADRNKPCKRSVVSRKVSRQSIEASVESWKVSRVNPPSKVIGRKRRLQRVGMLGFRLYLGGRDICLELH